jgi:hypothetical protein
MMYVSKDEATALFWARMGASGVVFIPIMLYHFTLNFLEEKKRKIILYIVYAIGIFFIFLLWRTNYFIIGLYKYSWGYFLKILFSHSFHLLFDYIQREIILFFYYKYR